MLSEVLFCLKREALAQAERHMRSQQCLYPPLDEPMLSLDIPEGSGLEQEVLRLRRYVFFRMTYESHVRGRRPDLISVARNVNESNEALRLYGCKLAELSAVRDGGISVEPPPMQECMDIGDERDGRMLQRLYHAIHGGYLSRLRESLAIHA